MAEPFTTKRGGIFIQPSGPNTEVYYLGCHTLGDVAESEGAMELLRCFNPEGTGWDVKGSTISPPDPVTFSVEARMSKTRSWIQRVEFPASFYFLQSEAGRRDNFSNYDSGLVLTDARRSTKTRTGVSHMEEDGAAVVTTEWEAYPPAYEIDRLTGERKATAAANELNDVWMNLDSHDFASWGERIYKGQEGLIVGDSAVGPAVATALFATDYANTLSQSAVAALAAGVGIMSVQSFYVGQSTRRYLVAAETQAAVGCQVSYSDDGGASWTAVNVNAVNADAPMTGGGLWAPNENFALLAINDGKIYKSVDGGDTWEIVENGSIAATDYYCVHADPSDTYCIAGGVGGNVALSSDGGETWVVSGSAPSAGEVFCAWRFDENNMWVGTDDGELYYSNDGGDTWTERTRFVGTGVGAVNDMWWINRWIGFVAKDTAAPVGKIMRTINGGYDWEDLTTPANDGINAICAPEPNLVYGVGPVSAATSFICRFKSVGIDLPTV